MRLPIRKIKIAGQDVRVKLDASLRDWGNWYFDDKLIVLGKPVIEQPDQLKATLKHEVRHAALDLSGVSHGLTAKTLEQVIRCFDEIADPAWAIVEARIDAKTTTP